ncbi:hypothetical protein LM13656_220147 [Listeria monocytogenes]|nr:hypothetical protein LMOATCC19117_0356 [Listeria monocytogenes ATCC 19117]CUK37819.1 hypothetical protein LM13656_220147 [Listeria monocytogenes]CUM22179.1 hypothetical protein LM900701_270145 [Listeria monocytogenes]CUM27323.1 hypothetical protein LM900865_170148 [Listeria monocytogenes]
MLIASWIHCEKGAIELGCSFFHATGFLNVKKKEYLWSVIGSIKFNNYISVTDRNI